jgi:hypothetical protein
MTSSKPGEHTYSSILAKSDALEPAWNQASISGYRLRLPEHGDDTETTTR